MDGVTLILNAVKNPLKRSQTPPRAERVAAKAAKFVMPTEAEASPHYLLYVALPFLSIVPSAQVIV